MSADGLAPRRAALAALQAARSGTPLDRALERALGDLVDADRRLAHELAAGVLRTRTRLDDAIAPHVSRGLASVAPDLLDILRIGAYQLLELDRVPVHAAVATTVALARDVATPRATGFVNAILRRVAVAPRTTVAAGDLGVLHSHPAWLVDRWCARFGHDDAELLLLWNNSRPSLVLQPARASLAIIAAALDQAGIAHAPAPFGAGLVVSATRPTELPGFAEGDFVIQDPAHALVAQFADPAPDSLVFDACAAPGGKAIALAHRAGLVVAADRTPAKVRRLAETLHRAGNGRTVAVVADATAPPLRTADLVALDVPCLGTGTFARHPDARWRVRAADLPSLTAQAARFLEAAATIVRPGGLLSFSTCSLEPEENEAQVSQFLVRHPEFHRDPGHGVPSELLTAEGDLLLLPHRHRTDGAYAARLRRRT